MMRELEGGRIEDQEGNALQKELINKLQKENAVLEFLPP